MKKLKYFLTLGFLTILIFLPTFQAQANSSISPALLVFRENLAATEFNPAIIGAFPQKFKLQLDFLGGDMGTNSWTLNQIFDNANSYIDENTKAKLLRSIGGKAMTVDMNVHSGLFLGYDKFAFSSRLKGSTVLGIDKEIFTFLLEGVDVEDMDIRLNNTSANGNAVLDNCLSYAMPFAEIAEKIGFESFHIGAGLHYLYGMAWAEFAPVGDLALVYDDADQSLSGEGKMQFLSSSKGEGGSGHGFALDLGVWGQYDPQLAFGLSLTNLGAMRWNGVRESLYEGTFKVNHPIHGSDRETFEQDASEIVNRQHDAVTRATPITLQASVDYAYKPRIHFVGTTGVRQTPKTNFFASVGSRFLYPTFMPITLTADYASHRNTLTFSTSLGFRIKGRDAFNLTLSDVKMLSGHGKSLSLFLSSALYF